MCFVALLLAQTQRQEEGVLLWRKVNYAQQRRFGYVAAACARALSLGTRS